MATTLKLYYTNSSDIGIKWELIPSKLLVVEDIAGYLATKSNKSINNFQYIKNELELQINVDISQEYSQPRSTTNFKYVSIQNEGELIHYYFVKKATWRSKTCVRFELVMDVLNTFQEGRDFNFKANTRIVREHKSRFIPRRIIGLEYTIVDQGELLKVADDVQLINDEDEICCTGHITSIDSTNISLILTNDNETDEDIQYLIDNHIEGVFTLQNINNPSSYREITMEADTYAIHHYNYRNIDIVNEGITPVLQCGTAYGKKIENPSNILKKNWYLLYRNQNDPSESLTNPVDCFLIPETTNKTDVGFIENGRLVPSWIEEGKTYFFIVPESRTFTLSNGVVAQGDSYVLTKHVLMLTKAGNKITAQFIHVINQTDHQRIEILWYYDDIEYIDITNLPATFNVIDTLPTIDFDYLYDMSYPYNFNNSGSNTEIDAITNLDKGDPKNIKLIKVPYCPYDFAIVSDILQIASDPYWEFVSFTQQSGGIMYALKLKDMNLKLSSTIREEEGNPIPALFVGSITPNIYSLRQNDSYESKLYHSDFYQPTYVYDSFTYKVQMEKLNPDSYSPDLNMEKMIIHFYMTSTINSRFMFEYENLYFKYAVENYAKYMPIARNNEEVLYNVPYINYIRNGFNYDVKAKERTNVSNTIGLALSSASTLVSLALPSVPLKVAGVVAGLVSMAMSMKNTVVSAQQNEDSIRKKLQETANQTASVAGSDDVDLMSVYAENRLKYLVYEPTPLMKSILFDLFFYAGYASGRIGIPTHNNRVNFDYLECEANLENEGSIPDDCLQELINCFKTGITYLHKTTRTLNKWDFEQKYENWERYLLED